MPWIVSLEFDAQNFLESLSDEEQREVKTFIDSLEQLGPDILRTRWARPIKGTGGLCELRPQYRKVHIRLYYFRSDREYIIVLGHRKQSKREQQKAIKEATKRMNSLKEELK
jgi:hypothetical protein